MNLTIPALREMMLTKTDSTSKSQLAENQQTKQQKLLDPAGVSPVIDNKILPFASESAVSVDFSVSHDVFSAVDDFFNLGKSGRFNSFHSLSPEDKEQFVTIVAELAKSGYVGFEELLVNKRVERHEITSQIGDQRLRLARVYDSSKDRLR